MRTGDTIRLVPPLGAVFVAWAPDDAVDEWLSRGAGDAGTDRRHLEMLAAVRELGYVVELQPPSTMFDDLLGDGRGAPGARPVRAYDPGDFVATDLVDDRPYAVSSISVPVFGAGDHVVLALNLISFPAPVAGAEIRRLAAVARGAAAHVHA